MFSWRPFLFLVIAMFACVRSLPAAEESPYVYLKLGAEWTMDAKLESPKGGALPAIGRRVIEEGVEKDGKKYLRERTWLEVNGKRVGEYTKLVRKDDTGFYTIFEGQEDTVEKREIALPLKVGESWEFTMRDKVVKFTVIGFEAVTLGSKIYENCVHLRSTAAEGKYVEDFWESPSEGSVKSEVSYGDGTKITLTIKEFKAGK